NIIFARIFKLDIDWLNIFESVVDDERIEEIKKQSKIKFRDLSYKFLQHDFIRKYFRKVIIPIDIDNLNHEHIFEKIKEFLLKFIGDFLSVFQFVTTNNVYCYAKMLTQNKKDRKNLAIIDEPVTLDVFKKRLYDKIYIKLILKHTNESIRFVDKSKELCEYVKIPIKKTQGVKDSLLDRMAVSF